MRFPDWGLVALTSLVLATGCQSGAPAPPTSAPAPAAAPTKPAATAASPAAVSSPSPAAAVAAASPAASPKPAASPAASPSAVAAAASPSAVAGTVINFDANEYSYSLPDSIPAGQVTLVMRNVGKEAHHAQFFKLNTNVTFEQFIAALQQGVGPALALVSEMGGDGALDPGLGSEQVTVTLQPGNYVVMCFLAGPDGVPHFAKGMVKPLQVTGTAPPVAAVKPTAAVSITLRDFTFDTPDTLPSGSTTWAVTNNGPQPHELQLAKLASGGSAQDILKFFSTTPPTGIPTWQSVGGFQGLDPNNSGTLTLNLTAGDYAFYCAIPDPSNGLRHLQEGMLKQVTVR